MFTNCKLEMNKNQINVYESDGCLEPISTCSSGQIPVCRMLPRHFSVIDDRTGATLKPKPCLTILLS
jgi:hypothetical protein